MPTSAEAPALRVAQWRIALALAAVYVVWGSTYLAMRVSIETLPPLTAAGLRYLAAGGLVYGWARWRGAPPASPRHWRSAAVIGALLLLAGNGGVMWAEQQVPSGLAALVISTEPLWIVLLVWMRRGGRRPSSRVAIGLVIGFAGLALLVRPSAGNGLPLAGTVVLAVASICWAAGSVYSQRAPLPASPLLATGIQMLCGGALLFLAGAVAGEPARLAVAAVSSRSVLALIYLVVFGSMVAFTCYSWLLRVASPVLVSTYAYVNPVIAVFLGWALAQEPITSGTLLAAAVILAGVVLITTAESSRARRRRPQLPTIPTHPAEELVEAEPCLTPR
jgi:drug/metabolite transporter (DMT)-like permease